MGHFGKIDNESLIEMVFSQIGNSFQLLETCQDPITPFIETIEGFLLGTSIPIVLYPE
jgi:hypothetical protein